MPHVKLPNTELRDLVGAHSRFLRRSCAAFDAGDDAEALAISTSVRALVHDTNVSHSILDQLGVKSTMTWCDAAEGVDPTNLLPTAGLVELSVERNETHTLFWYAPRAVTPEKYAAAGKVAFEPWWTDPVTKDADGLTISRRDYILGLCHKDGGAHADGEFKGQMAAYERLTRQGSLGFSVSAGGPSVLFDLSPAPAAARQIATEVLLSVERQFGADIFAAGMGPTARG